jgi:hypothetical protein
MKNRMTSRDYELISAYLDNQLGEHERTLLEARLNSTPELRKELHEISKTRLLVQSLPRLRAPRNYYVNAEAVRVRPTLRLAPVFGIVSAVASVLLALVIFGSTIFTSTSQVALAPAPPNPNAALPVQPEIQRSGVTPIVTTEAPPAVMLGVPMILSPTPNISPLMVGQTEIATPTTIFLYAFPPTSTPENSIALDQEATETAHSLCEDYYGGGIYPTRPYPYNCPTLTPSSTNTQNSVDLFATPSPTPSITPTPIITPTFTPTATPTPTFTPSPTSSPTPTPTEMPPALQKIAPTNELESTAGSNAFNTGLGAGNPSPSETIQTETPSSTSDTSFIHYILLTIEVSLASIAIIAGITAIILRIRAGR